MVDFEALITSLIEKSVAARVGNNIVEARNLEERAARLATAYQALSTRKLVKVLERIADNTATVEFLKALDKKMEAPTHEEMDKYLGDLPAVYDFPEHRG